MAWLFPSAWGSAAAALAAAGTAVVSLIYRVSPVFWIPGALISAILILLCAVLLRALRDPNFGHAGPVSIAVLEDADLKRQASKWLVTKLSEKNLHIQRAALFGSIVHDHFRTSDVDVIVEFKLTSDRQVGKSVRRIKGRVAQEFKRTFGHDLHVKFFCADERPGYDAFAAETKHEGIIS